MTVCSPCGSTYGHPVTVATDRYTAAVAAIDRANATDPVTVEVDGVLRPKELAHADVVERWVRRLDAEPSEAQLLAARAHHLRRWVVPRSDYPEGRSGYLRWRADHKRRQAEEVADLLRTSGYDDETIERVSTIVAKRGLGHDPDVQTHEDALCLTFLEFQFDDLAVELGDDRTMEVVRKTVAKMSDAGLAAVADVALSDQGRTLLAAALAQPPTRSPGH